MASVSGIRPFIQKWEGGLSRNTADSASSNPAPWTYKGVNGWHTNKGVTYKTFAAMAPVLGYQNNAENFFNMPDEIWDKIIKVGYWDTWDLDNMNSQAIADLLIDFSWGSGASGSFKSIKKYLATKGVTVNNQKEAVQAINKLSFLNEETTFLELVKWREAFFRSLNSFATFGRGWLNRLDALKTFGLETIQKKKLK